MRNTFLVHISGTRPHKHDHWTKPYLSQSTAAAQATRWVRQPDGAPKGDLVARIYRLGLQETRPGLGPEVGLRLLQVVQ